MKLYDYQKTIIRKAALILEKHTIVYLALEMRLGKTIIALTLAKIFEARRVVFITKKKAVPSINQDYQKSGYSYEFVVTNYESAHKEDLSADVVILDEAHTLGTYPKPNLVAKMLRKQMEAKRIILLSGTPSPETYSQLYHQFWAVNRGPWQEYPNFYKWAGNPEKPNYINVRRKLINGIPIPDYKKADESRIRKELSPIMVTMSQEQAGFQNHNIAEQIIAIDPPKYIENYVEIITRDRMYTGKDGRAIIADTPVKLMQKVHQIWSGTVLIDEPKTREGIILSRYKAEYIKEAFLGKKIAIYYLYRAEREVLRQVFGNRIIESPLETATTDKIYIGQIRSGSMGVNLSEYEYLIFMNISFSAMLYFQARARTGSNTRTEPQRVVWVFAKGGIENKIYEAVSNKKDYTLNYFRQDYINAARKAI